MRSLLSIALLLATLWQSHLVDAQVVPVEGDDNAIAIETDETTERPRDPYKPRFLAIPVAGYTPDTSVILAGLGMLQFRPRSNPPTSRTSTVSFAATYTLRQQWLVGADPSVYLNNERIWLDGRAFIQDWHADYFGIGPNSRLGDQEEYVPRRVNVRAVARHTVGDPRFYVGAGYSVTYVAMREIESGGLLDVDRPSGIEGGLLAGPTLSASWDDRDNEFCPHRGTFVTSSLQIDNGAFGSDFDTLTGVVDARGYVDLGRRAQHILAGRAYVELGAGDAPFYELASLGGARFMRGMTAGRLRDHNALALEIEYRTPFVGRFGFVTFSGLGEVFGRFDELQASPRWTAGGGVRLRVDRANRINLRLDYGVSREEFSGAYFSVTEAF